MACIDFAAEHMSATVSNCTPPSKADASLRFGVTMSAMGRSSSLPSGTNKYIGIKITSLAVPKLKGGTYLESKKNNNNK